MKSTRQLLGTHLKARGQLVVSPHEEQTDSIVTHAVGHQSLTFHSPRKQTQVTARAHAVAHLTVSDGPHMMMRHKILHLLRDSSQCMRLLGCKSLKGTKVLKIILHVLQRQVALLLQRLSQSCG